jgi:hypothetical protein
LVLCNCHQALLAGRTLAEMRMATASFSELAGAAFERELALSSVSAQMAMEARAQELAASHALIEGACKGYSGEIAASYERMLAAPAMTGALKEIEAEGIMESVRARHEVYASLTEKTRLLVDSELAYLRTAEIGMALSKAELQGFGEAIATAVARVSDIDALASFRPAVDGLLKVAAGAKELWKPLLESADLGYAMASFSAIGKAIDQGPYSLATLAALRSQLGDWSQITRLEPTLDAAGRLEQYYSLGLEPRLVSMETPACDAALRVAGIRPSGKLREVPAYVPSDLDEIDEETESDEGMVDAYQALRALESQFRAFLDLRMTQTYGRAWIRQRVPGPILERWRERQKEDPAGQARKRSLLCYADFDDYPQIICRKDNWGLFEVFFERVGSIQESFARLSPLRKDVAHMRSFTSADRLFFHVEIRRLSLAMRRRRRASEDGNAE